MEVLWINSLLIMEKNNLIFLNCLDKTHEFVRFDLDEHSLLLINSNVNTLYFIHNITIE